MQVEPSVMDSSSSLHEADTETQGKTLKTWNDVHKTFKRLGNKPTKGIISTETSEQEEERLKMQDVDGIGKPLYLGQNVDGSDTTLPPMIKGEELIRIPLTNNKSTRTLIENVTKIIAQHPCTGRRDISEIKCWRNGEHDRPHLKIAPMRSKTFCDNMTLWAAELYLVIRFFECFDLTTRKEGEAIHRFGVTGCGSETKMRKTICRRSEGSEEDLTLIQIDRSNKKFKVMLCGVPLTTVGLIHKVLNFAHTLNLETLNSDEKMESISEQFKAEYWKDFHPKNLLIALRYASQFMYIDTDLTTDYCGTLHIPNLETTIRERGGDCVRHSCGKNMIRQASVLDTDMKSRAKFYNKFFETLSSPSARSKEVGHKLHYILNPSTPSLKETFRTFHAEGVSRFETTHSSLMAECAPDLESMLAAHEMLAYPLSAEWNKTLVVSSMHEHILQIESAADCSVATYFPHMTCLKASSLKAGAVTAKTANKEPEGCLVHLYNSDTQKFVGNMIHSQLKRYGNTRTEGFQLTLQNLAWGSLCRHRPILAICVAGPGMCLRGGKICTDEGFDVKRSLYFRLMCADVHADEEQLQLNPCIPARRLMCLAGSTGLYTGNGSLRFNDTDMQLMGVDLDQLDNMRIRVPDKKIEPSFENMGSFLITLRPLKAGEDQPNSTVMQSAKLTEVAPMEGESACSSEVRRHVAGVECRVISICMLPSSKVRVQKYFVQTTAGRVMPGQKKEGRTLVILAGGDKYKVPDHASNGLLDAVKANEAQGIRRQLFVWLDKDSKFRWEFDMGDSAFLDNSQTCKAALIPVGEWLDILDIGETQHARGGKQMFARIRKDNENKKYFLPLIIKEQLFEYIKKEHVGLKDLRGWRLIRPFTGLVKTVPRSKHEEPPIFMKDSSGTEIKNHVAHPHQGTKRELTEPSGQGLSPTKRARH